jgi:hypothetical protein
MVGTGCALHFSFSMIGEKKSKKMLKEEKWAAASAWALGSVMYYEKLI